MEILRKHYVCVLALVLALVVILPTAAQAVLYSFAPLTNNTGQPWIVVPQLSVEVTEGTGGDTGLVLFTFLNNVGVSSSITDVYFDDGALGTGIDSLSFSSGVNFVITGTPPLPGGNSLDPDFDTSFSAGSASVPGGGGVIGSGVSTSSEWLTVKFEANYDDVLAAIALGFAGPTGYSGDWASDSLRVGIHVQGIPFANAQGSTSEGYIMTPVPGAVILGLLGLGIAGWKMRRFA